MADKIEDEQKLLEAVASNPFAARLPQILREAHQLLFDEPKKRLSQS